MNSALKNDQEFSMKLALKRNDQEFPMKLALKNDQEFLKYKIIA